MAAIRQSRTGLFPAICKAGKVTCHYSARSALNRHFGMFLFHIIFCSKFLLPPFVLPQKVEPKSQAHSKGTFSKFLLSAVNGHFWEVYALALSGSHRRFVRNFPGAVV